MKKLTTIQWITASLILFAIIWEICVAIWARDISGPVIRLDLLIILPVIIILLIISIIQGVIIWYKSKRA